MSGPRSPNKKFRSDECSVNWCSWILYGNPRHFEKSNTQKPLGASELPGAHFYWLYWCLWVLKLCGCIRGSDSDLHFITLLTLGQINEVYKLFVLLQKLHLRNVSLCVQGICRNPKAPGSRSGRREQCLKLECKCLLQPLMKHACIVTVYVCASLCAFIMD